MPCPKIQVYKEQRDWLMRRRGSLRSKCPPTRTIYCYIILEDYNIFMPWKFPRVCYHLINICGMSKLELGLEFSIFIVYLRCLGLKNYLTKVSYLTSLWPQLLVAEKSTSNYSLGTWLKTKILCLKNLKNTFLQVNNKTDFERTDTKVFSNMH